MSSVVFIREATPDDIVRISCAFIPYMLTVTFQDAILELILDLVREADELPCMPH